MSRFTPDADWLSYHPSPTKPRFSPPPGSVDAHCHVFGPGDVFPYAETRKYTPCDAGKEQLWALRNHLGFSKNVIVQASCHGSDNRALIDALEASENSARGVAVVTPDVSDEALEQLHTAGVRAVRFNFVKRLVDVLPKEQLLSIAERIKSLGWHIVIYFESQELFELYNFFTSLPTEVVVDHMGRPDLSKSIEDPAFQLFHKLMREHENFWCKVTCPERLSNQGPPLYADFIPFAKSLVEAFPDRVLWGTDWPHPNMKSHMPDDGDLVQMIPRIAVTSQLQQKLLVDNPNRLYWAR